MAVRIECDDCGELIEQIRIVEHSEATTVTEAKTHDRCLSCVLAYLTELSEKSTTLEYVNPELRAFEQDGKFC